MWGKVEGVAGDDAPRETLSPLAWLGRGPGWVLKQEGGSPNPSWLWALVSMAVSVCLSAHAGETGGERRVTVLLIGVGAENQNNRSMEADASGYSIYSLCCFLFVKAI